MAIYVFNLLVLYHLGGLDTAQGNRSVFLRKTSHETKYIYDVLPTNRELKVYKEKGISLKEMLSIHLFMADNYDLSRSSVVSEKLKELKDKLHIERISEEDNRIKLFNSYGLAAALELNDNKEYFNKILYYHRGLLFLSEWYGDRLMYSDYYVTVSENGHKFAKRVKTTFLNREGKLVYECLYDINGKEIYLYPDGSTYTKSELMKKFVDKLNLSESDIVILERPSFNAYVQPLFENNKVKKVVVFHSGHYFEMGEDSSSLYVNREYYYWYKYSNKIDLMIVSTEEQKRDLQEKLQYFQRKVPRIEAILAGGLTELKKNEMPRNKKSLLTVSRLVQDKKVEWVIESVIEARKVIPELTLDIFGDGKYSIFLKDLVYRHNAEDYIHFKGHCDVREVYKNYEVYISGSVFETLGLSVMEAIGSGNAVIGLDARYGNRLFIEDGKNGRLIDFSSEDIQNQQRVKEIISDMAKCIVEVFSDEEKLRAYQEHSYQIAERFLNEKIEQKWIDVIESL